ncbi:MAG: hypothetical protein ABI702_26495 [Burkholderiales bacterium]
MPNFYVVSGRLIEVHRFINVPLHWFEQYPARERRELWIATQEGPEVKFVVHSRQMPARCGHHVEALLLRGELVGLLNTTTGAQVNYARADPPLVWRRFDTALLLAVVLTASVSILLGGVMLPVVMGFTALAGLPSALFARLASNVRARLEVDRALEQVLGIGGARPILRRVK